MDSFWMMLQAAAGPAYYSVLTLAVVVGSLALISPRFFKSACEKGSYWVTTPLQIDSLDKNYVDTDSYMLQHCRVVGAVIIALAAAFAASLSDVV